MDKEKQAQEAAAEQKNAPEVPANGAEVAEGGENKGENAPERAPKEIFYERIRASRPDAKYDDDEQEVYRQAGSLFDELETGSKSYKDLSAKLAARFNENPEEATAFLDYLEGMPLVAAIRKNMGDEALTMQEGAEGWDEYQKAGEERKANRERLMNYAKEIQDNAKASDELFNAYAEENQLDEEQKKAISEAIMADVENLMHGKWSKEMIQRYRDAINHDADVDGAHEQGKNEGKNEAIEAKHKQMKGSGLPGSNAGGEVETEVKPADPREELARKFANFRRG